MTSAQRDPTTIRRLYGRPKGHDLRPRHARLMADLYPRLAIMPPGHAGGASATINPSTLFPAGVREYWLEIGFGGGEHLVSQAQAHPDIGFIGCEPFLNGMASLMAKVEDERLANVRVYRGDAIDVIERLPDASLARVFLLHPDPWPKARHAKRRFVNPGPLAMLARVMRPDAELRLGTDDPTYMRWTLRHLADHKDFEWLAEQPADWMRRPDDWPPTRYEQKALKADKAVWYFRFRRRD